MAATVLFRQHCRAVIIVELRMVVWIGLVGASHPSRLVLGAENVNPCQGVLQVLISPERRFPDGADTIPSWLLVGKASC
jgi:hypothetical protein